jgi:hypothetical protein
VPPDPQPRLAGLLAERARWVTGRATGRPDPAEAEAGVAALVLLRSLRLADVVHGAREFAAGLDPGEAEAWRESWTRTRFLFGNPANLGPRNPARVVAPGRTAAWLGPFPGTRPPGLSRLLKPVTGGLPRLAHDIDFPGSGSGVGPRRMLAIATGGLTLAGYLVHLHHTLAEAVLLGRLRPEEPLRLSHRPQAELDPEWERAAYARVLPEDGEDGRLRVHTWLSPAQDAGHRREP